MDLKIQTLEYAPGASLEYIVQGTVVVYCGITNIRQLPEGSSTTNAAWDIRVAIAGAVGRSADSLTFFELLTHTSWVLAPGEYEFQSVCRCLARNKRAVEWTKAQAPKVILEKFRHRIGGKAVRQRVPDPEEAIDALAIE